jgi:hypothetical protein
LLTDADRPLIRRWSDYLKAIATYDRESVQ